MSDLRFTDKQQEVIDVRMRNVLVSAAAGSGKTAVLVERIIRLVSEGESPADVDELLVVTFTRAAASEMKERIGRAIEARLAVDPENAHLQRQATLLHTAQITTIDSFCTWLLRNSFSDIGLDPGFRQMGEEEAKLLLSDALDSFLEKQYAAGDPAFTDLADYFCPGVGDSELRDIILQLYNRAMSHPYPEEWLKERAADYDVPEGGLFRADWMDSFIAGIEEQLLETREEYQRMIRLCSLPGGPAQYLDFLEAERDSIFSGVTEHAGEGTAEERYGRIFSAVNTEFASLPGRGRKKDSDSADPELKEVVKDTRNRAKEALKSLRTRFFSASVEDTEEIMRYIAPYLKQLIALTLDFASDYAAAKRDKGVIDFNDLEHLALSVVAERTEDGEVKLTPAGRSYREHFREILIDEYQDSNDVQELLLSMLSGESEGRDNRFMVGDVKQSIYKFRLARPEIFMQRFAEYASDDGHHRRIDLDRNFRSRREVIDAVNTVFSRIMRPEVGGVAYTDEVSLKQGASYPEPGDMSEDPWTAELMITEPEQEGEEDGPAAIPANRAEIMNIARRIRELYGSFPVAEDGKLRPATYGDIVVLMRSTAGADEIIRSVFEEEGIPCHIASRAGYFAAEEIRTLIQFLRVLDNPRQDIPLYGALRGYFGAFSESETALLRASGRDTDLYGALVLAAADSTNPVCTKCGNFLEFMGLWRKRRITLPIHTLVQQIINDTGYGRYVAALPSGGQRSANLKLFVHQAAVFEQTAYTGLFQFLRYLDEMKERDVDFGEASMNSETADVVRVMTIHHSKGLEFPVCIVAGLSKGFNLNDGKGTLIMDSEAGIGMNCCDVSRRVQGSTARKEMIADRVKNDSLGEELRVLYVAMTRAKEKLILSGTSKEYDRKAGGYSFRLGGLSRLPVSVIRESRCALDWILAALAAGERPEGGDPAEESAGPIRIIRVTPKKLRTEAAGRRTALALREEKLAEAAERVRRYGAGGAEDAGYARELMESFGRKYAHGELTGLFTKTSVTELKRRAGLEMRDDGIAVKQAGDGEAALYPVRPAEPLLPAFMKKEKGKLTGAARGTAIHRFMEICDYRALFAEDGSVRGEEEFLRYTAGLLESGRLLPEEAETLAPEVIMPFMRSGLGGRMARAERRGVLYREQPFVMGIDADRINPEFPGGETLLIQGIIDAFFYEGDGIVLVDYKTDKVRSGAALLKKYKVQLDYYAEVLERLIHLPVKEKLIYSFALNEVIPVQDRKRTG